MTGEHYENGKRVSENWDAVFRALSAEPRRQLVVALLDASPDQSVPLPESAQMPNVPSDPEQLLRELHHVHLPLLAAGDYITWEAEPHLAFRGPRFEEVASVFDALHSKAADIPDSLVTGCQRLEAEQQERIDLP